MQAVQYGFLMLFLLVFVRAASAQSGGVFNVCDYGAKGDGKTLETAAIQKAVDACAGAGGGQVLLPPGKYLSATVRLKSHVTFKLEAGAKLIGCLDPEAYSHFTPPKDMPEAKFPTRWHRALLLGDGVEDLAVVGPGTIDGNKVFDPKGEERQRGPHTILIGCSKEVTIRDLTIQDSANYAILLEDCSKVDVRQVRVTGGWDGLHFRGNRDRPCRNVSVTGCQFHTGDDAIAGRYWEDTLISNCILNSSCNAVRLIGPAKRLIIHDCLIYGPGHYEHRSSGRRKTLAGVSLQPGAWDATEGDLDDVLVSDITMRNVSAPFLIMLKPGNRGGRITVSRVNATGVYQTASSIESWARTPFERVVFRDVNIECDGGGKLPGGPVKTPGVDPRPLPAWGFYARGVMDLRFENVRLTTVADDARSVFVAEEVVKLAFDGLRFPRQSNGHAPLVLTGLEKLQTRDVDWTLLSPRALGIEFLLSGTGNKLMAGKPFSARAKVANGPHSGLAKVVLEIAGNQWTQWVWLEANETRTITFAAVTVANPGSHDVTLGDLKERVTIE
jgi:hypothetical protein